MEAAHLGVHLWAQSVRDAGTDEVRAVRKAIANQALKAPEGVEAVTEGGRLIAAGEQSGQLENMLLRAATTSEQQSEMAIAGLLSMLEPVMILLMGVTVGYIVLAILLPIFDATSGF